MGSDASEVTENVSGGRLVRSVGGGAPTHDQEGPPPATWIRPRYRILTFLQKVAVGRQREEDDLEAQHWQQGQHCDRQAHFEVDTQSTCVRGRQNISIPSSFRHIELGSEREKQN